MSENDVKPSQNANPTKTKLEIGHNLMTLMAFIVLALVAVVTLLSHQDPSTTKSVLGGCVTLGVIAIFFL